MTGTYRIPNVQRPGRVGGGWEASGKMLRLLCLTNVMSVREVSPATEALLNTKKSTLVRNPISATHVEKALPELHTLSNIGEATSGKKFHHSDHVVHGRVGAHSSLNQSLCQPFLITDTGLGLTDHFPSSCGRKCRVWLRWILLYILEGG